jgi:uracil-DNA glycosylase
MIDALRKLVDNGFSVEKNHKHLYRKERFYRILHFDHNLKCKSSKILKRNIQTCKDWLIEEIQEYKPQVLCSLGIIPTKLFLKFSSIGDVAGKTYRVPELNFQLCPYYSLNYIVRKGKFFQEETSGWLKIVKEIAEC